ncbi:DUF5655 domain-containing protein [Ruminococcus sp.]|uniref:DUF5655 domain-containing protein n=2 Tax=Ruminococcus sp. TaxID=41978 RepID=UPI002B778401|nr:DUF5655 domain-containing protein [Ruminococcus sp.]HNZ99934.1 DUF5655 domain-containing protein [Ruminococcus sp.]
MATVTAISTKGGGGGKKSLDYICRDDKTEGKKYVTALNCSLPTAYQEFQNTRVMYGKTDGIRYYHFVQSHPSGYNTNYGLRPGTQLAGADFAAETSDRYAVRCQGSDRRDNDICTDGTVPAKSAENIRSAAGTGEGDSGADVTERDGRGIEAGSGGEGPRLTGWEEFKAEDFEKLSSGANKELLDIFETINDYCLSISQNIIRNTTKHYIGYSEGKSFADFHFNSGYCHLMLRTIKYSDPQNKIELLGDNYNWAKKAKLRIYPGDDLEYIKGLIKQSYDSLFSN